MSTTWRRRRSPACCSSSCSPSWAWSARCAAGVASPARSVAAPFRASGSAAGRPPAPSPRVREPSRSRSCFRWRSSSSGRSRSAPKSGPPAASPASSSLRPRRRLRRLVCARSEAYARRLRPRGRPPRPRSFAMGSRCRGAYAVGVLGLAWLDGGSRRGRSRFRPSPRLADGSSRPSCSRTPWLLAVRYRRRKPPRADPPSLSKPRAPSAHDAAALGRVHLPLLRGGILSASLLIWLRHQGAAGPPLLRPSASAARHRGLERTSGLCGDAARPSHLASGSFRWLWPRGSTEGAIRAGAVRVTRRYRRSPPSIDAVSLTVDAGDPWLPRPPLRQTRVAADRRL